MFELEMQTTNNCLSLHTGLAWSLIQTYQFINFYDINGADRRVSAQSCRVLLQEQ